MAAVNPYLSFNGNCADAFNFYKGVFGEEFLVMSRYSDIQIEHMSDPSESHKIMHVALPGGGDTILMGSDRPNMMGPGTEGNMFSVAIAADSEAEADKLYNGLAAGGTVGMPMGKAPWGAYFGMCTDKFGIQWMINHDYNRQ